MNLGTAGAIEWIEQAFQAGFREILLVVMGDGSRANRSPGLAGKRMLGPVLVACLVFSTCGDSPEPRAEPDPEESGPRESVGESTGVTAADQPDAADEPRLPALAITIDDLPWVGPLPAGWDRIEGTERILEAFRDHGVPAKGFVTCGRVQPGEPVLRRWLDAGHMLGNHTSSHLNLNDADPAEWVADARACDEFLRRLTGEPFLYFRYPYLHRGHTIERYRLGRQTLEELGSPVAPATIDTGDWILDDAYVEARRAGDSRRAEEIARAYVEHVLTATEHYQRIAMERVERDVVHILLLHANALLAEQLDAMLTRLGDTGFRFVTLEEALKDPVYARPDDYIGPDGLSWLYRIPPAIPGAAAWDDAEAERLRTLIR